MCVYMYTYMYMYVYIYIYIYIYATTNTNNNTNNHNNNNDHNNNSNANNDNINKHIISCYSHGSYQDPILHTHTHTRRLVCIKVINCQGRPYYSKEMHTNV